MKVVHVLADGSIRDDITGYRVNPDTKEFYSTLEKIIKRRLTNNETKESSSKGDTY